MKKTKSILETKSVGELVSRNEKKQLIKIVRGLYSAAFSRRKYLLNHTDIQCIIGLFFQSFGWSVENEIGFYPDKFHREPIRFDIVATKGKKKIIVEVKNIVSARDLGQIHGYANTLEINKFKALLFLGTDILNHDELVSGTIGKMVKELMERENVGVILVDKYFMILYQTYNQLALAEMPEFWFSEEPVGYK